MSLQKMGFRVEDNILHSSIRHKIGGRVKLSQRATELLNESSKMRGGQTRLLEEALEHLAEIRSYGTSGIQSDLVEIKHLLHSVNEMITRISKEDDHN